MSSGAPVDPLRPLASPPGTTPSGRFRAEELRSGARLGGLEVVGELGRGAMGVVYRARDGSGRDVALKLVSTSLTAQALERFRREGELLARLKHPGILRVHGGGDLRGRPYLVLELVEGARPLDEAARDRPVEDVVRLVRDAARAVGHAHAHGVVHRDLKPSNLLVDAAGAIHVADFGLASSADLDRLTATGALVGTPEYMAPEQCDGRRGAIGPQADVWALGVTLYDALTGESPFAGDTLLTSMARVCAAAPTPPRALRPEIPRPVEAALLAALRARAADRPADGEAFAALLDRALEGRDAPAGGRRLVTAAAGLAALAAVALWAWAPAAGGVADAGQPPPWPSGATAVAPAPPPAVEGAAGPVAATASAAGAADVAVAASAPAASAPDASAPVASAPAASAPDASAPDASALDASTLDALRAQEDIT